ncbi:ThiF family adenylyltransferase [Capnocytophaga canis]|uniref:ThiF family adenylyltransferase n=1 Tax=Capnocytophaga canis TaxID=1848903 RepID=UPI00370DE081
MIQKVCDIISKTETANIVYTKDLKGNEKLKKYKQVISVETELSLNDGLRIIQLYVVVKEPISVYLPKIYIDEYSYEDIKYIPHINEDLSICIIDENSNFLIEEDKYAEFIIELLGDAKKIIRGIDDVEYINKEFEREFQAYWDIAYSKRDKTKVLGLSLINVEGFNNLKGIRFIDKFSAYDFLVYNDEDKFQLFDKYLKIKQIKYVEIEVFQIDYKNVIPPFDFSLKHSVDLLTKNEEFRKRINKLSYNDFIVVFKNNYNELFGWRYPFINKITNGYRIKTNWQYLHSELAQNNNVERISFSNISPKRLDFRTSGKEVERSIKIGIVGLGSVGSNLLFYLLKYPISDFCLIDPDILKVENVFRNKFGFNYINNPKVNIAKYEILSKNPFTNVLSFNRDVIDVFKSNPAVLEQFDYRFIIVGVSRIEEYILNHLVDIESTKPIILIWVEPYLASGQFVFLQPEDFEKGKDLLKNYPYHILKSGEDLSMREGSCQTGYMPYSDLYLNMFLSAINSILHKIILKDEVNKSTIFTWIGDIDYIKNINLELVREYTLKDSFKIIENGI